MKAYVLNLVEVLKDADLTVWYDEYINVGEFKPQIEQNIRAADVFLALITKDAVGPSSSGWVQWEISVARDEGITQLLPCVFGDVVLPEAVDRAISGLEQIRLPDIRELPFNPKFKQHVQHFRDYIARGGRASDGQEGALQPMLESVPTWYREDHPANLHALMLSVACLEGYTPQVAFDAAECLETILEEKLRPLTEEEVSRQPRRIAAQTQSEKLAAINAERVRVVNPMTEQRAEVVRFLDPNWRVSCLTHVWRDVFDVREAWLSWVNAHLDARETALMGQTLAVPLGLVAQIDMIGVQQKVLNRWLEPPYIWNRVDTTAEILAIAAEERGNIQSIRDLLARVLRQGRTRKERDDAKRVALRLALGPLGLRRPELAIEVLRALGRQTFFANERLKLLFLTSQTVGAYAKDENDTRNTFEFETEPSGNGTGPEGGDTTEETPHVEKAAEPAEAEPARNDATETDDGNETATVGSARQAVAAAGFLAALGDWVDEKLPKERLHERHVPFMALLLAMERMPLERPERSHRADGAFPVVLADLVWQIRPRDPVLYTRIERGLVRAAKARHLPRHTYPPRRHLQHVCQGFAWARDRLRRAGTLGARDSYITFARSLYAAIDAAGGDPDFALLKTSQRFLTPEDRDAIRCGPPVATIQTAAQD